MRALMFLACLVVVPDRPAPEPPEAPRSPAELLPGDWKLEKHEFAGQNTPGIPSSLNLLRLTATDSTFLINGRASEGDGFTATYTIDWTKNPAAIDLVSKQSRRKISGIIRIDGDRLVLGVNNGDARPLDFTSAQMVSYFKRLPS